MTAGDPDVQPAADAPPVIVLVRDLLMQSRVTTAARRIGVATRVIRDPAGLTPEVAGRLAIVDLDLPGALAAGVAWGREGGRPVAGFVQHVNTEVIRESKAAGVWPILPRSRLEAGLPGLLGLGGGEVGRGGAWWRRRGAMMASQWPTSALTKQETKRHPGNPSSWSA